MMETTEQTAHTVWVCVDCYASHHGVGEEWTGDTVHPHRDAAFYVAPYTPPAPLSLISDEAEVTAGLLWEEHAEDCDNRIQAEMGAGYVDTTECGCERQEFSWSACQGCGSTLGGAREALTVWGDK